MKKYIADMLVVSNVKMGTRSTLLKLTTADGEVIKEAQPGQFVEVRVDGEPKAYLRRPISINYIDRDKNELWLLIQKVGNGTTKLFESKPGDQINIIYPLGRGFTIPTDTTKRVLLIGGGVGIAPLLFLASELKKKGVETAALLGAKTSEDVMLRDDFKAVSELFISTEDGSCGEKGFVTKHTILQSYKADMIYCCGPRPMMEAIARFAYNNSIECEVSLENKMACGIGVCLCCVEDTIDGNVCTCKEGPVFNIKKLQW